MYTQRLIPLSKTKPFCHVTVKIHHLIFFFNWNSLHAKLNSHYEPWSYKKKKHKKIEAYRKPV